MIVLNKSTGISTTVIAVFLLIAVNTFCKPCHGMMAMPCEHSKGIACIVLAVPALTGVAAVFLKKRFVPMVLCIINIACGVLLILTPKFGRCQVASMTCNTKTFPTLKIGGLLLIVLSVIFMVINAIQNNARREVHAHTK